MSELESLPLTAALTYGWVAFAAASQGLVGVYEYISTAKYAGGGVYVNMSSLEKMLSTYESHFFVHESLSMTHSPPTRILILPAGKKISLSVKYMMRVFFEGTRSHQYFCDPSCRPREFIPPFFCWSYTRVGWDPPIESDES